MNKQKTCADRVKEAHQSRIADIRAMYEAGNDEYITGHDGYELPPLNEYGLSIDYVEAGTFNDQTEPYIRYQLSWGGPSDEYRVYNDGRVEYWFLDWFDGAKIDVSGDARALIRDIVDMSGIEWPAAD